MSHTLSEGSSKPLIECPDSISSNLGAWTSSSPTVAESSTESSTTTPPIPPVTVEEEALTQHTREVSETGTDRPQPILHLQTLRSLQSHQRLRSLRYPRTLVTRQPSNPPRRSLPLLMNPRPSVSLDGRSAMTTRPPKILSAVSEAHFPKRANAWDRGARDVRIQPITGCRIVVVIPQVQARRRRSPIKILASTKRNTTHVAIRS